MTALPVSLKSVLASSFYQVKDVIDATLEWCSAINAAPRLVEW